MPSLVPRLPPGAIDMVCPVDWAHPLNKGLAEWWIVLPGMASGGKLLSITSAVRGAHGTLTNGPTWGPGPNGFGALTFDGTDDYVAIPDLTARFADQATFAAWLRLPSHTPGNQGAWNLGSQDSASHYVYGDGSIYDGTFLTSRVTVGAGVLADRSQWHLVTVTCKPGAGNWVFYQNAAVAGTSTGGASVTFPAAARFGYSATTFGNYWFVGLAQSFALWSRALSAAEVAALYEQSLRGYPDTLRRLTRAAWSFGGGGGAGTYTGSGAPSTDATTCAGTGTFTAPVYTGSGAPSTEVATTAGSGTHTAPTYTGTGTPATDETTCAGTGTFTAPVYTATGALATDTTTSAGTGTHTAPTYTGTGSPATDAPTATGSGTFTAPVYTGSASLATDTATLAGSGTFTAPAYTGSGTPSTEVATVAGTGTHTAPPGTYTGAGSQACETATCAGTGTFTSAASLSPRIVADTVDFAYTQADTVEFAYVHADTIDFVYTIGPDYLE